MIGSAYALWDYDGELIVGYTHSYNPERQGFFMLPADADDNNLRIFVLKNAAVPLYEPAYGVAAAFKRQPRVWSTK